MKQAELDAMIKALTPFIDIEQELPPPPPPNEPKKVKVYPYITINNEPPRTPKSFFATKKFYLTASAFALLAGYLAYALVFAH